MEIIIHSKKQALPGDFRAIVEERLGRLDRFKVRLDQIDVTVNREPNPRQGKKSHRILIATHGLGPSIRAEGAGFNDVAAFDEAAEKVEFQLRKIHERSKSIDRDNHRNHIPNMEKTE
jgi:ribosomal subunit interface protein